MTAKHNPRVPLMQFGGLQQTCHADWSRAVLQHYPYNPKYQKNGEIINVYYNDQKIAEFDFSNGTGYMVLATPHDLKEVGRLPNFERFDIDTLLV